MNQRPQLSPTLGKYNNMRSSLLMIVILSVINIFAIMFTETYFVFSAYITQLIAATGYFMAAEAGDSLYLIVAAVIGLISVLPYLLCWIFSKKHFGWMIGALIFFAVDSLLFFIDFIALVSGGDVSMIIDLVFRIYAIGTLALGIKYGLDLKNEEYHPVTAVPFMGDQVPAGNAEAPAEAPSGITRQITVTRKKSFVGCAVPIICYVNGIEVCRLKNGATETFTAPAEPFELGASLTNGLSANALMVNYGEAPLSFRLEMKMGVTTAKINIVSEY
ncbi:MAG: hypothetical protein IJV70_02200 [Clostridia bacterium]|nr:hypothetical protein [Clostridia bacterium]